MHKPYRTLFVIELTQHSDLSTGNGDITEIDMPFARDGNGRLILRGSSLAGALIDTTRKRFNETLPESVTGKNPKQAEQSAIKDFQQSRWYVHNAHLCENTPPDLRHRQHVRINGETGAQQEGSLFDIEVVPRGTKWEFLLDVDTFEDTKASSTPSAEQLAALALEDWHHFYGFLGRRVAAGNGWLKISKLKAICLDIRHADYWPDNSDSPLNIAKSLSAKDTSIKAFSLPDDDSSWERYTQQISLPEVKQQATPCRRKVFRYTLTPGIADDGYGLDGWFVGGHETMRENFNFKRTELAPETQHTLTDNDEPDTCPVLDNNNNPYIPGSSIRGALSHELTRICQLNGNHTGHEALFGTQTITNASDEPELNARANSNDQSENAPPKMSSALFVGDAYLQESAHWKGMIIHNHAEDEFTAGVYGSNKFVRTVITEGVLSGELILQARNEEFNYKLADLEKLIEKARQGEIAVGAKQWVDCGWLKWEIEEQKNGGQDE